MLVESVFLSIGEAAVILGVSTSTMRRWERQGHLSCSHRTPGQHRRFRSLDILNFYEKINPNNKSPAIKKAVGYSRVSGRDQLKDLETQAHKLEDWLEANNFINPEIIRDIGSGINFNKKGLKRLIHLILTQQISVLVLNHKDRLLRFGSELVFSICDFMGVEVVILEDSQSSMSYEEILSRDVIQLMTVYCAKLHGKRAHKNRKTKKVA